MPDIPAERDWRYLRSIFDEMLNELSRRLNDEVRATLARSDLSENEKRRAVYDLVQTNDRAVADCFDDWRRSRLFERCLALRKHRLLTPERLANLTPEFQQMITEFADR
jgi:hypothetical protein